jgi:hypothetical protein
VLSALLTLSTAFTFGAGCGAKVVFVGDDGEGAAQPSTSSGTPGSSVASSSSSSSSGGFISPCNRLCMEHGNCLGVNCLEACEALYMAGCEDETNQYVLCLAHNYTPACTLEGACDGEEAVYENCFNQTIFCVDERCSSTDSSCGCRGSCDGVAMSQACNQNNDFYVCDCEVEGVPIGTCAQRHTSCSIDTGCCKELWLLQD